MKGFIGYYRVLFRAARRRIIKGVPGFARNLERRFQAYCVGMPRTGTHSVSAMFHNSYRAGHEPDAYHLISRIVKWNSGRICRRKFEKFILKRDLFLQLELESSWLIHFYIDILVSHMREAKFILTVRDPYSWLDSIINYHYLMRWDNYAGMKPWLKVLEDIYFGSNDLHYSSEDRFLEEYHLLPVRSYLRLWRVHNQRVISRVPSDRLYVVNTMDIAREIDNIAYFLNIPAGEIDVSVSHSGKNTRRKFQVCDIINKKFLKSCVDEFCADLVQNCFSDKISIETE